MTQQKIDGIPIAEMQNIIIIKQSDGKWRIGYVLDNHAYMHRNYLTGTFNSVRDKVPNYVNVGCAIANWFDQWYGFAITEEFEVFSHATGCKTSLLEIQQHEAIVNIRNQTVVAVERTSLSRDPSPILSKSDEDIMADIQAGVLKNKPKPVVIGLYPREGVILQESSTIEEPAIGAAGALADAGLLNNQKIGLPQDLLRAAKWPAYWKFIPAGWSAIDTYRIGQLFPVDDPSGRIIHARKKLLVPGVRTGGKSMYNDIKEARDTLTQWLEDNPE